MKKISLILVLWTSGVFAFGKEEEETPGPITLRPITLPLPEPEVPPSLATLALKAALNALEINPNIYQGDEKEVFPRCVPPFMMFECLLSVHINPFVFFGMTELGEDGQRQGPSEP